MQEVDEEMRVLLNNLKEMVEAEKAAKSGKKNKGKGKGAKGGKGGKSKGEKSKKDKGKKGKKDPTENMSMEELYNELVMNKIIQVRTHHPRYCYGDELLERLNCTT